MGNKLSNHSFVLFVNTNWIAPNADSVVGSDFSIVEIALF